MIEPKRIGRPPITGEHRKCVSVSLTQTERNQLDMLAKRHGLDSRSATMRWLLKQELSR